MSIESTKFLFKENLSIKGLNIETVKLEREINYILKSKYIFKAVVNYPTYFIYLSDITFEKEKKMHKNLQDTVICNINLLTLEKLKISIHFLENYIDEILDSHLQDFNYKRFKVLLKKLKLLVRLLNMLEIKGESNYIFKTGLIIQFILS